MYNSVVHRRVYKGMLLIHKHITTNTSKSNYKLQKLNAVVDYLGCNSVCPTSGGILIIAMKFTAADS
jgi:hypothetical protein